MCNDDKLTAESTNAVPNADTILYTAPSRANSEASAAESATDVGYMYLDILTRRPTSSARIGSRA